jgi:hypothetical protein
MTSRPLSSGRIGFFPKNLLPVTTHGSNGFYGRAHKNYSIFFFYFYFSLYWFELKASHLLGTCFSPFSSLHFSPLSGR